MAMTQTLTANGWEVVLIPPTAPDVTVDDITGATPLGKLLLQADTEAEARLLIDAAHQQLTFVQDVYSWTGTQNVAANAFFNLASLAATLSTDSDAGSTHTASLYKVPAKASKSMLLFRIRMSGSIGGSSGTAREWKVQLRRPDGTTIIGSNSTVKVTGTDLSNRDHNLISYTYGATDPFSVNGFMLGLLNETGQTLAITSLTLTIQRVFNLE